MYDFEKHDFGFFGFMTYSKKCQSTKSIFIFLRFFLLFLLKEYYYERFKWLSETNVLIVKKLDAFLWNTKKYKFS